MNRVVFLFVARPILDTRRGSLCAESHTISCTLRLQAHTLCPAYLSLADPTSGLTKASHMWAQATRTTHLSCPYLVNKVGRVSATVNPKSFCVMVIRREFLVFEAAELKSFRAPNSRANQPLSHGYLCSSAIQAGAMRRIACSYHT